MTFPRAREFVTAKQFKPLFLPPRFFIYLRYFISNRDNLNLNGPLVTFLIGCKEFGAMVQPPRPASGPETLDYLTPWSGCLCLGCTWRQVLFGLFALGIIQTNSVWLDGWGGCFTAQIASNNQRNTICHRSIELTVFKPQPYHSESTYLTRLPVTGTWRCGYLWGNHLLAEKQ